MEERGLKERGMKQALWIRDCKAQVIHRSIAHRVNSVQHRPEGPGCARVGVQYSCSVVMSVKMMIFSRFPA